jgi:hypothetical protein
VALLDQAAGAGAYGVSQFTGKEKLMKNGPETRNVEGGEEEGLFAIGDDGLDGLGAGGQNGTLLGHEFE